MDWQTQRDLFDETMAECARILTTKGVEYASTENALANFYRAEKVGITPLQRWWVFAEKHWNSIEQYILHEGETKSEESIESRLHDLINYLILLKCMIVDVKKQNSTSNPTNPQVTLTINLAGNAILVDTTKQTQLRLVVQQLLLSEKYSIHRWEEQWDLRSEPTGHIIDIDLLVSEVDDIIFNLNRIPGEGG